MSNHNVAKHSLAVRASVKKVVASRAKKAARSGAEASAGECASFTVWLPVSQYVRVEAAAAEERLACVDAMASFLLSKWVLSTSANGKRESSFAKASTSAKATVDKSEDRQGRVGETLRSKTLRSAASGDGEAMDGGMRS